MSDRGSSSIYVESSRYDCLVWAPCLKLDKLFTLTSSSSLEDGNIVEQGSFSQLVQDGSRFSTSVVAEPSHRFALTFYAQNGANAITKSRVNKAGG